MANIEKLNDVIQESGMTMVSVANKAGMVRETLYNRLKGKGEFTAHEIVGLTQALKLTPDERDEIFLSGK